MERLTSKQREAVKKYNKECMIRHRIESKGDNASYFGTSFYFAKLQGLLSWKQRCYYQGMKINKIQKENLAFIKYKNQS